MSFTTLAEKKIRGTEKVDGYHYCLKPSVYENSLPAICSTSAGSQSRFFQSALMMYVRHQYQYTHTFQTGFYML